MCYEYYISFGCWLIYFSITWGSKGYRSPVVIGECDDDEWKFYIEDPEVGDKVFSWLKEVGVLPNAWEFLYILKLEKCKLQRRYIIQ